MKNAVLACVLLLGSMAAAQGRPGRGPGPGPGPREAMVCFYSDADYQGSRICFREGEDNADLNQIGFNDVISSVQVFGHASIAVYENSNYGGDRLFISSDIPDLNQRNRGHDSWNDSISSFNWSDANQGRFSRRPGPQLDQACFFSDSNMQGRSFCLRPGESTNDLNRQGMNDTISSIRVSGHAQVVVFENANFTGENARFDRDNFDLSQVRRHNGSWNDVISSILVR